MRSVPRNVVPALAARNQRVRHVTGKIDPDTARLCMIAGYAASGNLSMLGKEWAQLGINQHAGGSEIVLQNLLYNGMPRTLMALTTISEIGVKDRIICDPFPSKPSDWVRFSNNGAATIKEVYGYKHRRFMSQMRLLHPAYGWWVKDFEYGRVRSRPGVTQKVRALCELASIGGHFVFPQFRAGIMNALTCGATMEEVRAVIDLTEKIWGAERQAMVDALWRDLNIKRMGDGWRLDEADPKSRRLLMQNTDLDPTDDLKPDWSHLVPASAIAVPPWRHPGVTGFRGVGTLPDIQRIFSLAAAHASAGNLSKLRTDWSFIPAQHHKGGIEALLQTIAFSGFHRLHNALRMIHEQGVCKDAINPEKEDEIDRTKFPAAGEGVMRAIYTSSFEPLQKSISKINPDIWTWILEFVYGQILARDGLNVKERELSALGVLAGTATFPQLRSHMRGALNNGATVDQVRGILDQTETVWGRPAQTYVDGYWTDFAKEREALDKKKLEKKRAKIAEQFLKQ